MQRTYSIIRGVGNETKHRKEVSESMTDKAALKYALERRGLTYRQLAEALQIAPSTLYRKINNKTSFVLAEVYAIVDFLKLSNEELLKIFFAEKVA